VDLVGGLAGKIVPLQRQIELPPGAGSLYTLPSLRVDYATPAVIIQASISHQNVK
jgi:hypothetical protein